MTNTDKNRYTPKSLKNSEHQKNVTPKQTQQSTPQHRKTSQLPTSTKTKFHPQPQKLQQSPNTKTPSAIIISCPVLILTYRRTETGAFPHIRLFRLCFPEPGVWTYLYVYASFPLFIILRKIDVALRTSSVCFRFNNRPRTDRCSNKHKTVPAIHKYDYYRKHTIKIIIKRNRFFFYCDLDSSRYRIVRYFKWYGEIMFSWEIRVSLLFGFDFCSFVSF